MVALSFSELYIFLKANNFVFSLRNKLFIEKIIKLPFSISQSFVDSRNTIHNIFSYNNSVFLFLLSTSIHNSQLLKIFFILIFIKSIKKRLNSRIKT